MAEATALDREVQSIETLLRSLQAGGLSAGERSAAFLPSAVPPPAFPPPTVPPPETLRRYRLAAYTYAQLNSDHPARPALRPDYAAALYDHLAARSVVRALLQAWQGAGLVPLLFKGFMLSEFVYASPGQRPYGDVDLAIPATQAALASKLALDLGWTEPWNRERSVTPFHHELMTLLSPGGRVQLDVHERLVHNLLPQIELQRRVTAAVWKESEERDWDGLRVRLPSAADSVLVGLMLNRCWSDDSWRIGVHDLPDFGALVGRAGLTRSALRARARELECLRTLDLFMTLCSPYELQLRLRPRRRLQYLAWGLRVAAERGPLVIEHRLSEGWVAGTKLTDLVRELPGVLRVLAALRTTSSLSALTGQLFAPPPRADTARQPLSAFEIQRTVRGVHTALNLLRVRPEGNCLPRALAIAASLRRRGLPAVFKSGVRREGGTLHSHAWVEIGGEPMFDAQEPQIGHLYSPNFGAPATEIATGSAPGEG